MKNVWKTFRIRLRQSGTAAHFFRFTRQSLHTRADALSPPLRIALVVGFVLLLAIYSAFLLCSALSVHF